MNIMMFKGRCFTVYNHTCTNEQYYNALHTFIKTLYCVLLNRNPTSQ